MRSCLLHILVIGAANVVYASRFCGNCPPGYFVNGCKTNTTANCEPCPPDSYKLGNNALRQCTRCTDCIGRNNIEIQKCNGTHDRTCRCKEDYFFDTGALFCSRCSSCRRGKGVVKECTLTADTKCQRCVRGVTFSPVNNRTEPCRLCKKCGENEELVKKCTRRKDTECKTIPLKNQYRLKNKSKWPDKEHDKSSTAEPTTKVVETKTITTLGTDETETTSVSLGAIKQDKSSDNKIEIILYAVGAVVAVVFIVFVVIIIVKHRRKSTHPKRPRNQVSAPSSPPLKVADPVNRLSSTPLMHGSTDKLLRDVSYSLIDELSRHLNPKGRWKTLAGKLGFSSKDIDNFELQPTNATEVMLSHWGQQKGSTLRHLYDVLKSLKWLVEADMVAKYLS